MTYLDHAAATPLSDRARYAMEPFLSEQFFNPSSPFIQGKDTRDAYNTAKQTIGTSIGAKGSNIVITASATESNNLAFTCLEAGAQILISPIEHPSVYRVAEARGNLEYMAVDEHGRVSLDDIKQKITPELEFISLALANHELGTIQPISEIAALVRTERLRRLEAGEKRQLILHTDASAALNTLQISVARLGVDLMTFSSAKIYGPKGVAALYVSPEVRLKPLIVGGGQENGLISGTENVPGVIGFSVAIKDAQEHAPAEAKRLTKLKQILVNEFPAIDFKHQLSSHVPLIFDGLDAERLIYLLEDRDVLVTTGAACSASKGQKSNVLTAINLTDNQIAGSLRLTLGRLNDESSIREATAIIKEVVSMEKKRVEG